MYPFGIFTKRVNLICLDLSGVEILPNGGGERILESPENFFHTIQVGEELVHNFPEIIFPGS